MKNYKGSVMREKHGDIILTLIQTVPHFYTFRGVEQRITKKKGMLWLELDICVYLNGEGVRREGAG